MSNIVWERGTTTCKTEKFLEINTWYEIIYTTAEKIYVANRNCLGQNMYLINTPWQ